MKYLSRLTALLLALVLLFSSSVGSIAEANLSDLTRSSYDQMVAAAKEAAQAEAAAAAQEAASQPIINEGGVVYAQDIPEQTKRFDIYEVITDAQLSMGGETEITLPQSGKINLSAGTAAQWQIYIPGADMWVNIAGEIGDTFALTYAVIGGMLSGGSAKVRALAGDSAAVANVSVAYGSALPPVEEEDTFASEPMMASTFALRRDANAGIMLLAEGDDETTHKTYNVIVNYIFENNVVAAEAYTANLAAGSNFSANVTFPTVQGYLPYLDDVRKDSLLLSIQDIQADVIYNVVYKPTDVNYTVIHYWQNTDNDGYHEQERETLTGLTKSVVPEVANEYPGFYALIYEKPEIAADGSTIVEVYYDRYYYLMNFELYGGYGTEPIYARYDADLGTIPNPTRAGYTFKGWSATDGGTTVTTLPTKMPTGNVTYYAIWEANPTAKVSVVFWGENPNDEGYSYLKTGVVDVAPGTKYTYSDGNTVFLICGKTEHTHTAECGPDCGKDEHITHTDDCISCSHASHTLDCYQTRDWYTLKEATPGQTITATQDGVYTYRQSNQTRYYLYLGGKWYCYYGNISGNKSDTQSISLDCDHTHTNACYSCEIHQHTEACYSCGIEVHTHNNSCNQNGSGLNSTLWKFVRSETVTVEADGSSVINVYYDRTTFTMTFKKTGNNGSTLATITDKWGADIKARFETISKNNTFLWSGSSNGDSPWTSFLDVMPSENRTYYAKTTTSTNTQTATYLVQKLGTTAGTAANYETLYTVSVNYGNNLTVSKEEFVEIEGFTFNDPLSTNTGSNYKGAKFYYDRNSYAIEFYSPTTLLRKVDGVEFEAVLTNYDWTPDASMAPVQYEPGSVEFEGWYLNPQYTGGKYDFAAHTMPAGTNNGDTVVTLYAKWVPVTHTVKFYLDYEAYEAGMQLSTHPEQEVTHGEKSTVVENPTNGQYTFIGWFYMDEDEEKAFDFAQIPVTQDMQVYGKWSSNTLTEYTIYFKLQGTDTEIADPVTGSGLAGTTKTFDAKGGTDLYENYQEGYFPVVKSHSLTLDIEDETKNIYTFEYVQKDAVPYTVYYVTEKQPAENKGTIVRDGKTYYIVADTKTVSDNRKAVVTETFKAISGYMPDAYQKRLVVDGTDGAVNEIIFYYTEDIRHAYYKITHYTQNTDGETWTEYASSQAVGDIGTRYTGSALTIPGFSYSRIEYSVDGAVVTDDITAEGVKLTTAGLEINLYYVRNAYPYQVRYLEQYTNKVLADPKDSSALYGKTISENAIDIDHYTLVGSPSQSLNIRIENMTDGAGNLVATLNVITFYYTENEAKINYTVVGPTGCGTVTPETEQVKKETGYAQGSTAAVTSNAYKFVGWYSDAACTMLVSTDATYVPTQPGRTYDPTTGLLVAHGEWPDTTTYYAKFEWNLADLTISKSGLNQTSGNDRESAIFIVTDSKGAEIATVVIPGNGSVVIGGLTVGETYTVTELNSWTWRYTPDSASKSVEINPPTEKTEVTFTNSQTNNSWLGGDNYKINKFN